MAGLQVPPSKRLDDREEARGGYDPRSVAPEIRAAAAAAAALSDATQVEAKRSEWPHPSLWRTRARGPRLGARRLASGDGYFKPHRLVPVEERATGKDWAGSVRSTSRRKSASRLDSKLDIERILLSAHTFVCSHFHQDAGVMF